MTTAVTAATTQGLHGRTQISPRAVRRVVSAVTAEALGVKSSDVSVEIGSESGSMTVVAKAPVHVPALGDISRAPSETLIARLGRAQSTIRDRSLALTGRAIGRVDLQITGATTREQRRVQ